MSGRSSLQALAVAVVALALVAVVNVPAVAGGADTATLVKDINPGGSSTPHGLTRVGGTLYFVANDGSHGQELWKSDGTRAGTRMVRDIAPGSRGSKPTFLTNVHGTLFFAANDGLHGTEWRRGNGQLWKSDGTKAGTVMVKDFAGADSSWIEGLVGAGQRVFFIRIIPGDMIDYVSMWVSDGTKVGTRVVPGGFGYDEAVNVAGTLFFAGGTDLTKTDGIVTKDVKGIDIGWQHNLTAVGKTLYFSLEGMDDEYSLWRTDGTRAGTTKLADVDTSALTKFGQRLAFFTEYFDASWGSLVADELWTSDGTVAGTHRVAGIDPTDESDVQTVVVGDQLYFTTRNVDVETPGTLWRTDGTTDGTQGIKDVYAWELTNVHGTLCFLGDGPPEDRLVPELWESDGTADGTQPITVPDGVTRPGWLTAVGDTLFFTAKDGVHGKELWAYMP